jgi:hypothetical protein
MTAVAVATAMVLFNSNSLKDKIGESSLGLNIYMFSVSQTARLYKPTLEHFSM